MNNELNIGILNGWIDSLKEIMAEWNGDESGTKEDRAHTAEEALKLVEELKEKFEALPY